MNQDNRPIHCICYASQPNLRIHCDHSWSTPKWGGQPPGLPANVYEDDDGHLYTFENGLVSCQKCIDRKDCDD